MRLAGRDLICTVRRSARARHVLLRVLPDARVELVVPLRTPVPALEPLLHQRAAWITGAVDRIAARPATARQPAPGDTVLFQGQPYQLVVTSGGTSRVTIARDEAAGTVTVALPVAAHREAQLAARLEAWYRARAREALSLRATARAAELGVSFGRLAVRDQRTRWGSCSARGNLSFSWRLILAPPPVLDYLVVHELAHRLEANHGPRFWALVGRHCPAFREHRAWLRRHGPELMALWR